MFEDDQQNDHDRVIDEWDIEGLVGKIQADWDDLGKHSANKIYQMMQMEKILLASGWLDKGNNNYSNKVQMADFIHGDGRTQVQWKTLLSNEKSKILASRECEARGHGTQSHVGNGNPIYNTNAVKVVDREYLYKDFVAKKKEDRCHIDDIVQEFTLNEEQERAFKIIANHSVYDAADQLKMYIGGMAGTGKSQVIKALIKFFERKQQSFVFPDHGTYRISCCISVWLYISFCSGNQWSPGK